MRGTEALDSPRPSPTPRIRLHVYLAQCGVGSRRACERLIAAGSVAVTGRPVTEQGSTVQPGTDTVRVSGREVHPERKIYLALNKPRDVLCTCHDPTGRRTFLQFVPRLGVRLYPVGRLDRNSEGLLIVTNDGALAEAVTHPRYQVVRRYLARVAAPLSGDQLRRLRLGVTSEGEQLRAERIVTVPAAEGPCYEVQLREGRKREIRRMFEVVGSPVLALKRTQIGPLELGTLRSGRWRYLAPREVDWLKRSAAQGAIPLADREKGQRQ